MQRSEDRVILSASEHPRRLGVLSRGGAVAVAGVERGDLVVTVAAQKGRCLFAHTARELVRVQPHYQPVSPRWRVGGSAFVALTAVGLLGVALGGTMLGSGFHVDRDDQAGALWLGGGLLLAGGAAATSQAALVLARWRRPALPPFVDERDLYTFERGCEATPLARVALRLSQGERAVALATDSAGQIRVALQHLGLVRLGPGPWQVTRFHSGAPVGVLHVPPLMSSTPGCDAPGTVLILNPEQLHISPTEHLPALRQAALALADHGAGCYTVVSQPPSQGERIVVLAGSVQEVDGISALQLRLLAYPQLIALPGASTSAAAVPEASAIGETLARAIDALLRAPQGGGAQTGSGVPSR